MMNKKEYRTETLSKADDVTIDMVEKKLPGTGTHDDAETIEVDRPTVRETETRALVLYHGPKKTVTEGDAGETATLLNPGVPARLDDQGDVDDQTQQQATSQAPNRDNRKSPMDFFNDFKDAYCLGEPQIFRTPDQRPMMSINVNGHYEHIFLESHVFDRLCHYFSIKMNKKHACSSGCINHLRKILTTVAFYEGPEIPVHVRYAKHGDAIYIDLANGAWQQVKITATGWEVIENIDSPVKFIRRRGMKALPIPQNDFDIEALRGLLNVDDDDWRLIVAWLLGAMNPDGPFPILILQGQQGSAKTSTAKLLKDLIDPSDSNIQSLPKSERDLIITANNSWVLNFDNLSGMSIGLADAFCRVATGSGFRTRKLFTDDDEVLFNIKRPVIMNGITDISRRSDFIDRAIIINMPVIPEENRISELTLKRYWEDCKASIFGHLCNAISTALANYEHIRIENLPRMADFAQWVNAGEPAFGWKPGTFLVAYENARINLTEMTIESDPVASTVIQLMETHQKEEWTGNATQLLDTLELYADNRMIRSRDWPKAPNVLSNQLRRSSADLLTKNIFIKWSKSGSRSITIRNIGRDDDADTGRGRDEIEATFWEEGVI